MVKSGCFSRTYTNSQTYTTTGCIQQPDVYNSHTYTMAGCIQQQDVRNSWMYTAARHIQQPDVNNSQTYTIALNLFMVRETAIGIGDKIRGLSYSQDPNCRCRYPCAA